MNGEPNPDELPLPPCRTIYAPWKCVVCGFIYESLDEPGIACGFGNGAIEITCKTCMSKGGSHAVR